MVENYDSNIQVRGDFSGRATGLIGPSPLLISAHALRLASERSSAYM